MLKRLFIFILLFALIIAICLNCATYFLKPFLKGKILEIAKKNLEGEVTLSEFDISLLRGIISLKNLKIKDSKLIKYSNALTADEIILDIDLLPTVFKKNLVFQKIYLKNLAVNLKNTKGNMSLLDKTQEAKLTSQAAVGSNKELFPQKSKGTLLNALHIKKLLIQNSKFVFIDYSVTPLANVIEIVDINGRFDDITASLLKEGVLKGTARLKGRFDPVSDGSILVDGAFAKSGNAIDFDFKINLDNVNLIRFSPYYSNTSFAILKEARLNLSSKASCQKNQLNALQDARIYDIKLQDITPSGEEMLFGLPAKTVIEFFNDLKGDIEFNFNIVGTIDDPKFDPGPLIKQILLNAMRDKIISKLQGLPEEVIKMGEKVLNEQLKMGEKLQIPDEGKIEKKIEDVKKKLKKIIDYKP